MSASDIISKELKRLKTTLGSNGNEKSKLKSVFELLEDNELLPKKACSVKVTFKIKDTVKKAIEKLR